ncbi:MAG: AbrB family transcriptional regulator [Anaerolineae bacterium]
MPPQATLALLVGGAGGLAARWVGLPGGALVGAILAAGAASLLTRWLREPPSWLRSVARIVLGLTIGVSISTETLAQVARALPAVALMVAAMIAFGVLLARAISRLAHMDLASALCGTTPGGLAAMVALADDLGADAHLVASMQLVRMLSIILLMPILARTVFEPVTLTGALAAPRAAPGPYSVAALALLLLLGLVAGAVAIRVRLPAGEMLAGLALGALVGQHWLGMDSLPAGWQFFAQWIIGAGVGARVTQKMLAEFRPFALAGSLMTVALLSAGLAVGLLMRALTGLDLATCVIGSAPGGAEQMVLLAGELGGDVRLVAAMHISRQVVLMVGLPFLLRTLTPAQSKQPCPMPEPD